jgi:hypothetical protein
LSVLQRATYIYQLRSCTCAHPSEAAVQNINGLSILIVEDESLLALALLDALIQAGCKIIEPVGQLDVALMWSASAGSMPQFWTSACMARNPIP